MPNEKYIQNILQDITFPRLSGTRNEQVAANYIKRKIKNLNLTPETQSFIFTSFYPRIYKKIAFILIFWVIVVFFLNINVFFTILNVLIVILIFIPLILITRKPENLRIGKNYSSENVYVNLNSEKKIKLNENPNHKKVQVLFLCHIDSKSQRLSIRLRVISVKLWI
ncbi:MAG: hypothetical protein ACQERB_14105, partial [Promethearchaeati archaeon]